MEPIKLKSSTPRLTRDLVLVGLFLCHTLDSLALSIAFLVAYSCSVVLKYFDVIASINATNSDSLAWKLFALNQQMLKISRLLDTVFKVSIEQLRAVFKGRISRLNRVFSYRQSVGWPYTDFLQQFHRRVDIAHVVREEISIERFLEALQQRFYSFSIASDALAVSKYIGV